MPPTNTTTNIKPDPPAQDLSAGMNHLHLGSSQVANNNARDNATPGNFDTYYTLKKKLQGGSYGTVFVGVNNLSEKEYAVKVVDRRKLSSHDDEAQIQEVEILRYLNPGTFGRPQDGKQNEEEDQEDNGIINCIDFYPSPNTYRIVMELAKGGDVFDRLAKRKVYTEKHARDLARRMLESIQFLHSKGIAHRDIKPENLLLMDECSDTKLKLADFGFARRFDLENNPEGSMKTKCGTPAFVPPELVLGRRYGPKCDVWSAGCTLFMLLSGRAPFNAKKGGKNAMFRAIRAGDFVFYDDYWGGISMSAKKLVLSMLHVDPKARTTAEEALQSEWMQTRDETLRRKSLDKSLTEIVNFKASRKWRGAIGAVMYAAGGKFWNIDTAAIWREDVSNSVRAVAGNDCTENDTPVEGESHPTFDKLYKLDSKLQKGVHATVWQGRFVGPPSIETRNSYAIKVIEREHLDQLGDASVLNEVSILRSLGHKNIVPLLDFFETPKYFYLVMEKCNGGDVLERVSDIEQYSERDACEFAIGLLEAVQFMHERKIAHRDLKPQNLLLESNANNTACKICDFGYAKRVHMPQSLTTLCGSLHYVAPELLKNHPYDESADMWSVGVIIFFLLVGFLPFHSRDQDQLFKVIRLGKFRFDSKYWDGISDEAMELIASLLEVDPSTRCSATKALQSTWIKDMEDLMLAKKTLLNSASAISMESTRLQTLMKSVQWLNKSKLMSSLTVD